MKVNRRMNKIDKNLYIQWQDKMLCYFFDKCKSKVHCFLYPDIEYFKNRMQEKYDLFLKRTNISTDKDGLRNIDDKEWNRILGRDLNKNVFCDCIDDLEFDVNNGIIKPLDQKSQYINCKNGHRITVGNRKENTKRILIYGACSVFGLFCDDARTICSYLQAEINKHGYSYNVINCGVWGSENIVSSLFSEYIDCEDIVIILLTNYHGNKSILENKENIFVHSLTSALDELVDIEECLINNIAHFNTKVNYAIAMQIYEEINSVHENDKLQDMVSLMQPSNYFIGWNVYFYYTKKMSKYYFDFMNYDNVGCVVMNCNPVTVGHQYLVEYASKKSDLLIVFIVEEDLSEYKFVDRYRYAQYAFSKFKNVRVVPSGKYAISIFTFPDYFERNQIKEYYDVEYDLRIFSEVIAPMLNIKKRFVGDEPFSVVTRTYNDAMKRILPEYGIDVEEVSRLLVNGEVVSASLVRSLIARNMIEDALRYVPDEVKRALIVQLKEEIEINKLKVLVEDTNEHVTEC